MKPLTVSLAILSVLALNLVSASAEDDEKPDASKLPPASTQTGVTYEKDIKPILDKSCIKCHGNEKPKGKLSLTTLAGILKGSKDGPVLVAGKSDKSQIVFAVAHVGEEDEFMPPLKNKANIGPLTKEQVGLIRAWIDQGAK